MNKGVFSRIKVRGCLPTLIQDGPFLRIPPSPGVFSAYLMWCPVCDRRQTCDDLNLHYRHDTRQHINESGGPQRCYDCEPAINQTTWNLRPANVQAFEERYGYRVPPAR